MNTGWHEDFGDEPSSEGSSDHQQYLQQKELEDELMILRVELSGCIRCNHPMCEELCSSCRHKTARIAELTGNASDVPSDKQFL